MPRRISVTTLNASTIDILNTIRANASLEYQNQVPAITKESDIPRVGEVLYGYPALANQFINTLVNRIAATRVKSAVFNNPYKDLKKGYLEFGETIEDVFVNITKAREFSVEKADAREHKRSMPDVRTAFHTMNYRVQYPITIQDEDLRMAFLSMQGVQDLIAKIVDAVYTAAEYDEYLLFKYLMIKGITQGQMKPIAFDSADMKNAAKKFRGASNKITFMSKDYNGAGVTTATPKQDQYIFMDADFNAEYDVDVLAAAFNMDKADFMGKLKLIDDWSTFDNDRFKVIMAGSDQIEEVTQAELDLMKNVKAVLVDGEWFQVYDNMDKMTEKYVASGMYWNYFYNVWKTVSFSPFSNAIVFVDDGADTALPDGLTFKVSDKSVDDSNVVLTLLATGAANLKPGNYRFIQTQDATTKKIAVHPYGAVIMPSGTTYVAAIDLDGTGYTVGTKASSGGTYTKGNLSSTANVGDTITFFKDSLF